ncbi:MAG: hypothetical protein CVU90_15975 [Firmicutes bacterium HGW-Firmicutes-15]|nr:MAG: hypothetical protein CVV46_10785 [Spirochaetae bacterium HGW-Spirochaetae-2]PKM75763.1 MAG: hypothetical protein CVU90_15975 [Firmicutes bacterium HGW-Firmicutes-15]
MEKKSNRCVIFSRIPLDDHDTRCGNDLTKIRKHLSIAANNMWEFFGNQENEHELSVEIKDHVLQMRKLIDNGYTRSFRNSE